MSKKKYNKQKVDTYVSAEVVARLKKICKDYGYKSIYQLLQYLIHCFLRVADPENDPVVDPMPDEIKEMFTSNSEWEQHKYSGNSHAGMSIKKKPDQRKIKTPDDLSL